METWIMTAKDFWIIAGCFSALGMSMGITISSLIKKGA